MYYAEIFNSFVAFGKLSYQNNSINKTFALKFKSQIGHTSLDLLIRICLQTKICVKLTSNLCNNYNYFKIN